MPGARHVTTEDVAVGARAAAPFGVQAPDGSDPVCIWCGVALPEGSLRKATIIGFRCARRPGHEHEDRFGNAACIKRQYG
jgi:hypothetical protein